MDGDEQKSYLQDLIEATNQITSTTVQVEQTSLGDIDMNNKHVFFLLHNLQNEYMMALFEASQHYVTQLIDYTLDQISTFLYVLIISLSFIVLTTMVFYPVINKINHDKEEIISLFLDIPERTVKQLYSRCEGFVSTLQVDEEDDGI